jgi:DNA-binding HxlR family transcriptional regulator
MANKLVNIIRNLVKEELSEMAAPSFSIKILDKEKAERLKKLNSGHWSSELIDLILSSEEGTTRNQLADELGISSIKLNDEIKALQDSGIISRGRPEREPSPSEPGQRGRKTSDTSREGIVRALFQKFADNPDFEPTEDDLTYSLPKGAGTEKLAPELLAKVKNKALGLSKRGRPKSQSDSLQEMYLRLQRKK